MTTTTSTSAASSGSAILTALNANNGIDTASLVTNLVSATYDPKTAAITAKQATNTAQISSLATLTNGIDTFSSALQTLISGGTLFTQPTSSDTSVLTATANAGSQIGSLSAQLSVRQVAQAQSVVSPYYANAAATVGTGTIVIGSGANTYAVTIDSTNNTLAGLAQAINSSGAGVTASVVTDSTGARLTIKGATGAANAFTITPGPNADADLSKLSLNAISMTASGSAVVSQNLTDATTATVGQGTFTLTTAQGTATVTIGASNDNLNGLAAAISAAGVGLTATVVTDSSGSRLSITDGSGSAPSFTLQPSSNSALGQARFVYPQPTSGLTVAQTAQDAIVRLDGVDVSRASNTISDLVDGVTLNVVSAAPNETINLGVTRPTDAIKQAVSDFVDAYNELKSQIDTATAATVTNADGTTSTGPLYNNSAIRQMQTQLSRLTSTVINTTGGPSTLAEIGVTTNRDGTLSLDSTLLTNQLTAYPDAVEAMFNPTQHTSSPLIKITSAMGAAKPGTYQLTNITAQTASASMQGTIAGVAGVTTGGSLYASVTSAASGLVIQASGDIASATVTVDLGLGGALQAIRDSLRASGGVLDALSTQLTSDKTDLADQMTDLTDESTAYHDRLTTQFAAMSTRVAAYKATQSYMEQQIAVWTKSDS